MVMDCTRNICSTRNRRVLTSLTSLVSAQARLEVLARVRRAACLLQHRDDVNAHLAGRAAVDDAAVDVFLTVLPAPANLALALCHAEPANDEASVTNTSA